MTSDQSLEAAIEQQEQRVAAAMENLREEIRAYRQMADAPPKSLKDGEAKLLNGELLQETQLYANRFQMMRDLAVAGQGAEVGVQTGNFSRFLLDEIKATHLFLYDLNTDLTRQDVLDDPRTTMLVGDSSANLAQAEDQSFDWIYIDGDHREVGVRKDIAAARQKIKPDGLLIFNDYTPWSAGEVMPYGVMPPVNDLINEGYPVAGVALAHHGYFDIAVRYIPL